MSYDRSTAPAFTHEQVLERRAVVAAHYGQQRNQRFTAIPDIEGTDEAKFAMLPTAGTILEPAVNALTAAGVHVEPTMGGLMNALGLSQQEVHELACECHGAEVSGAVMEYRFENLKH
jgi:hypothetical protein